MSSSFCCQAWLGATSFKLSPDPIKAPRGWVPGPGWSDAGQEPRSALLPFGLVVFCECRGLGLGGDSATSLHITDPRNVGGLLGCCLSSAWEVEGQESLVRLAGVIKHLFNCLFLLGDLGNDLASWDIDDGVDVEHRDGPWAASAGAVCVRTDLELAKRGGRR